MNNKINEQVQIIITLIIIILIKHIEFEEVLITSYLIKEEEDSNILPLILLCLQYNKKINKLKRLNRSISNYWFNEIYLNIQDFKFKRHF